MMKRGELGEEEEEALFLSWKHDHNLFQGDSSSSSTRFCLRSPSDNELCDGSSSPLFNEMMKVKYNQYLSLLHSLNISEEEEEKNHHQRFTRNQPSNYVPNGDGGFRHGASSTFRGYGDTFHSVRDLQGYIYLMAKDQHGCRSLQKILEDGTSLNTMIIFNEVFPHLVELMVDPFGNYLMQKLLDVCNEEQRTKFILIVTTEPGLLVRISLNTHGTRVVQRLVESIKTKNQIFLVKSALRHGFLDLARDLNGNHVIQRCLQCLTTQDNEFIFEEATMFCIDISTHQHGCCVLQKCIAYSTGQQRENLITKISRSSLFLAQDRYGNYAVQYVIEMRDSYATAMVLAKLKGHYVELSMQKFSSHMVERCLTHCPESRPQIVLELISFPRFDLLIQDPYANFVIQAALSVTKGSLHAMLVEVIRPHSNLRKNPYCKRIFSRNLLRN